MTIEWIGLKSFKNPAIIAGLNQIAQNVGETLLNYSAKKVKEAYVALGSEPLNYPSLDASKPGTKMAKYTARDLLQSIKLIKGSLVFYVPGKISDENSYAHSAYLYERYISSDQPSDQRPWEQIVIKLKDDFYNVIMSAFVINPKASQTGSITIVKPNKI